MKGFDLGQSVLVDKRVHERHPEIDNEDVLAAWDGCLCSARRAHSAFDDYVAVGFDSKGRLLEMIAVRNSDGAWYVYHAFTPPTKKVLEELGLSIKGREL